MFHTSTQSAREASDILNVEAAGTEATTTKDDPDKEFLRSYMECSISCKPNGSYSLKFPWKDSYPPLPSNYNVCERRTRSLARRLAETPGILQTYGDIISEQQSRGFVEQVLAISSTDHVHYIPHHPVRKESSTTSIRIVYDCSCCQSHTQPSLNDCLMAGPQFLNDMCGILLRCRTCKYRFSTDIEKAFLHVTLHEADRDYTHFLGLSDPTNPDSDFNIYLFGSVSSPFMLNAALHYHLHKFSTPIAADIETNLYVDNVISGDSETDAVNYYNTSKSIMIQAKFNL